MHSTKPSTALGLHWVPLQSLQLFRSRVPLLAPDFPPGGLFFTWIRLQEITILDHHWKTIGKPWGKWWFNGM